MNFDFDNVFFQNVVQIERKLGGRQLGKSKQYQFQFQSGAGSNLCLGIEELSPGWRCKLPDNYQVTGTCRFNVYRLCCSARSIKMRFWTVKEESKFVRKVSFQVA